MNAKRYIYHRIILAAFLGLFWGCSEDFLDRQPFSNYTAENFWEDEVQINQALNGVYPILRNQFTNQIWRLGEFQSDNTTFQYNPLDRGGLTLEEIDYFLTDSNNGTFGGLWSSSYTAISRVNFILASIDDATFTNEENRAIREAEARFLRAFFYYHLTIHFGDVPLVLEPLVDEAEAISRRRDPLETVYEQAIVPDLEFAIAELPEEHPAAELGRATKGAAEMLLAKAYFARRDYAAALPLINSVVNSGNYGLLTNYRNIFAPGNGNNSEIIFAAEFSTSANQGAGFMVSWLPFTSGDDISMGLIPGSRAGLNIPTRDMIQAYEPGDRRFDASVGLYISDSDTVPYVRKFVFPPIETGGANLVWPIFRYADALLMQAEALVETEGGLPDQAFQNLNLLRSRAGLPLVFQGNPRPELNIDTEQKLREFIRKERRVEMAFESWRWYDLLRYGTTEEVMTAHGEEQKEYQDFLSQFPNSYMNIRTLMALPAGQVIQYSYEQNPGW